MPRQSNGLPWSSPPERKGAGEQINEFKTLVVSYAKQETIDPLKALGRSMGFGIAGSVMLGTGFFLLLLALLRGLQQIDFFNEPGAIDGGTWSWLPYLITSVTGLLVMFLFLWRLAAFSRRTAAAQTNEGPR